KYLLDQTGPTSIATRCPPDTVSRPPHGAIGSSVDRQMVRGIVPRPLRALGRAGIARVGRGVKGGEGPARGDDRRSPQRVSFFARPPLPFVLHRFQRGH